MELPRCTTCKRRFLPSLSSHATCNTCLDKKRAMRAKAIADRRRSSDSMQRRCTTCGTLKHTLQHFDGARATCSACLTKRRAKAASKTTDPCPQFNAASSRASSVASFATTNPRDQPCEASHETLRSAICASQKSHESFMSEICANHNKSVMTRILMELAHSDDLFATVDDSKITCETQRLSTINDPVAVTADDANSPLLSGTTPTLDFSWCGVPLVHPYVSPAGSPSLDDQFDVKDWATAESSAGGNACTVKLYGTTTGHACKRTCSNNEVLKTLTSSNRIQQ